MNIEDLKKEISLLSQSDRDLILRDLSQEMQTLNPIVKSQEARRYQLDNKLGCCGHCGHKKYVKFGVDKGSQRYKCKSCKRSFTEYT